MNARSEAELEAERPPQEDGFGLNRPRVHLFHEADGVVASAARALDRRQIGAGELRICKGGLAAAKSLYERSPSPELIVIESHLERSRIMSALDTLAAACEVTSKLIIIGRINDVHFYRELIQRNISDYLIAPLAPGQLAASIRMALGSGAARAGGRLVAVIGAKGGCGASTICHNTGWALAELAKADTMIADFDLAFGTLGLNFNQDASQGLHGAIAAHDKLDAAMLDKLSAKCSDHLSLLASPCTLAADSDTGIETASAKRIATLLRQTCQISFLDMPTGWTDWSRALIEQADSCVIVAEPDLASLRNTKSLADAIRAQGAEKTPLLVMNKVNLPRRPELAVSDFANAVDLQPALTIGFDARVFGIAANNGLMIGELAPKSRLAGQFVHLARQLAGDREPRSMKLLSTGFLKPLISRLNAKLAS